MKLMLVTLVLVFGGVAQARIVYMGLDPTNGHLDDAAAGPLAANAAKWAGGSADPSVGIILGNFSPFTEDVLDAQGFTFLTVIDAADLGTTDLNLFDVLYFGPTTVVPAGVIGAAVDIQTYVDAGGGLVVETQVFDANSWSWVPFANLIGHSGAVNVVSDAITITQPWPSSDVWVDRRCPV